jgi:hypothetical protein
LPRDDRSDFTTVDRYDADGILIGYELEEEGSRRTVTFVVQSPVMVCEM